MRRKNSTKEPVMVSLEEKKYLLRLAEELGYDIEIYTPCVCLNFDGKVEAYTFLKKDDLNSRSYRECFPILM